MIYCDFRVKTKLVAGHPTGVVCLPHPGSLIPRSLGPCLASAAASASDDRLSFKLLFLL